MLLCVVDVEEEKKKKGKVESNSRQTSKKESDDRQVGLGPWEGVQGVQECRSVYSVQEQEVARVREWVLG